MPKLIKYNENQSNESDEDGGSTDTGASSLDVEAIQRLMLLIREGEKHYGITPETKIKAVEHGSESTFNLHSGPARHPLLENSQQFDGISLDDTPVASSNPLAIEQYQQQESRLENQLKPQPSLTQSNRLRKSYSSTPRLSR